MCGIVGCILKDNDEDVAPILFDCISKLEYRGYDSIGLATYDGNIHVKKDKGKIDEVNQKLDLPNMPGDFGIAHVRWATHGDPSKLNSHPQLDEENTIAVVHNGIIENNTKIKASFFTFIVQQGTFFSKKFGCTREIPYFCTIKSNCIW